MTKSARLDFKVQRNEDFGPFIFGITAPDEDPVSIRDWQFTLAIDFAAGRGAAPALAITQFPNANGSYIAVHDEAAGEVEVFIALADMSALPGQDDAWVGLVHNLLASDELGYERAIARGKFIPEPGV